MNDIESKLRTDKKKYLIRIVVLAIINIILYPILTSSFTNSWVERLNLAIKGYALSFTVLGLIIGLIVAAFPYQELSFRKKYLRASLLSIYIMHVIVSVLSVLGILINTALFFFGKSHGS
jgi:uncharacterized protein YacL